MTKISRAVIAKQQKKLNRGTHWVWEEPYLAAMREQSPVLLPERLVTAEKAILLRVDSLREAPENLAELKALREALNSLYSCEPNKSVALTPIVQDEEEYQARQRSRRKLAVVAIAVIFSFAIGWILAQESLRNDFQSKRNANETNGNVTSSNSSPPEEVRSANHEAAALASRSPKSVAAVPSGQPAKSSPSQTSERLTPLSTQNGATFPLSIKRPNALEPHTEPQSGPPPAVMDEPSVVDLQSKPPEPQAIPHGSVTVSLNGYPSILVPPEFKSPTVGAKVQIGEVVYRIDPVYPEDAEWQRIEGIVKLHAIIGTGGTVRYIEALSGPLPLAAAAVSAVLHWRYQPTLLAGQPIEVGRDFNVVFRLERDSSRSN